MVEKIVGLQVLVLLWFGAYAFQQMTGAGFMVSGLVGGGGIAVFSVAVLIMAPKFFMATMIVIYVVLAAYITQSMGFSGGSTIVWMIIAAGTAAVANFAQVQTAVAEKQDMKTKSAQRVHANNPVKSFLKGEQAADLYKLAEEGVACGLIDEQLYKRICSEITEYAIKPTGWEMPNAFINIKVRRADALSDADIYNLGELGDLALLRPDEREALIELAYEQIEQNKVLKQRHDLSRVLHELASCRAIDMRCFLRAMLEIDPDYPPTKAKLEFFTEKKPAADAMAKAKLLFQQKLISVDDYQSACDAIAAAS